MNTLESMHTRQSTRAFLDKPVSDDILDSVLDAARWAPSGVNMQPWHIAIVQGETLKQLSKAMVDACERGEKPNPEYAYYPNHWDEPYRSRRKATGLALYQALGVTMDDKEGRKQAWYNNYRFFDAPVGVLVFMDRRVGQGSWLDMGMLLQNLMLAAVELGLATCPQASLADFPDIVRRQLGVDERWMLLGGLSLGYADPQAAVNAYRMPREPLENIVKKYY